MISAPTRSTPSSSSTRSKANSSSPSPTKPPTKMKDVKDLVEYVLEHVNAKYFG
ncbi:MAG: hypothetical protein MZU97_11775 [Bacillus subtilis]|nr:hypothetical protein [Bacillus subtilis]